MPASVGEEAGRRQMARPAVAPRDRLVGDALDERLQEAELAPLGRERIGLDREQLLADEARRRAAAPSCSSMPESAARPARRERLAEHGGVLEQPSLGLRDAVEPRRDQRVQRLRNLERGRGRR